MIVVVSVDDDSADVDSVDGASVDVVDVDIVDGRVMIYRQIHRVAPHLTPHPTHLRTYRQMRHQTP